MVKVVDDGMIWFQQYIPITQYDSSYTYYGKIINSFLLNFNKFFTSFMNKNMKEFH